MSTEIKASAIPLAGYIYQTLQGVNLLCDWLDAPTRYVRIRFECDDDEVAPQGLDDIVAERQDGRVDVTQVKFTPSPDKYALDWDWLLTKPGKAGGTSRTLLRKWFDALAAIDLNRLGEVCLITNRAPDLAMETCLAGGAFIDYKKAPADVQAMVEANLSGEANALRLFQVLRVFHSDKGYSSLEHHVTSRLRKHSTVEGIETLKNRAVQWAIQNKLPAPEGWITFEILQSTLQLIASEPLPEDFVIPTGYKVPDTGFHAHFVSELRSFPNRPVVLTGPPGRGKSTYLSAVCETLGKLGVPFIRHHYYLSATDRTVDRYTSYAVEEALLAQIQKFHAGVEAPDRNLARALAECAAKYKADGKPFVVIIDGLDHVWRTQGFDKRPLDQLFDQLLPAPENLVLVVGTQPVDDVQLPNRLLTAAPRATWNELPATSAESVLHYLRRQVDQGRLTVNGTAPHDEQELQAAAAELRSRTGGHPLHVIYATEELVRTGCDLSKWSIEQLSGDLSQNATTYYASLWYRLSASQRNVLRLICGFPFFWPKTAFAQLAALAGTVAPNVGAVEHLLYASPAGLRAFHESLIVFVKQTENFQSELECLTGYVEVWLSSTAPDSLRVNWLWAVRAQQGKPEELIEGLQRDWVVGRLQEGYPTELFEDLLANAEEHAVQRIRYADAYRLRHLKTRLLNSLSYQLMDEDAARLRACTWTLAPDDGVIDEVFASRHEMSVAEVAALGTALMGRGKERNGEICGREVLRRARGESRFSVRNDSRAKALYLAKSLALLRTLDGPIAETTKWIDQRWEGMGRKVFEAYVDRGELRRIVQIAIELQNPICRVLACESAFRAAALAGVDLCAWAEFGALRHGALVGCLSALAARGEATWLRSTDLKWHEGGHEESRAVLCDLAHDWFFGAAHVKLTAAAPMSLLKAPVFQRRKNIPEYLDGLSRLGWRVAKNWKAGAPVKFSHLYEAFGAVHPFRYYSSYDLSSSAEDFRCTLHGIAIDIHLLSVRFGASASVDPGDLKHAMEQAWFDADAFRTQYVSGLTKMLSDEAADLFIRRQMTEFDANVNEETGVRMMAMLELCEMAIRHQLTDLAADLCRRTWELVLGYAQRKDPALSDLMDALRYLAPLAPDDARRLLAEVAPQVHNVLSYTDGKGTRHVLLDADKLLACLHREALVEKYHEHTENGDWYYAENSLTAFLTTLPAESELAKAVLRTGVHPNAVDALRTAAEGGDALTARLLAEVVRHNGADVGRIADTDRGNSPTDWKAFPSDVKTYGVGELDRLIDDLKGHYGIRSDVLREWYQHWEAQGQGSPLINVLEPKLLADSVRDNDLSELLDLAFETTLKLEGKAAAFRYMVQAQMFRGGWLGPMLESPSKSRPRLQRVASVYRPRCDEFFLRSSYSWLRLPRKERVIPSDIMVYFLGLQGRTEEAVQFTQAMVQSVQDDTRSLRLKVPSWAAKLSSTVPTPCVELELLFVRLRWPVASARWWVMQELADLLLTCPFGDQVLVRLTNELRACRLEIEAAELLSVFWMAFHKGWVPPKDLGEAVSHPSMLTNRLLAEMKLASLTGRTPPLVVAPDDYLVSEEFERRQGRDVPRVHYSMIARLEGRFGFPFVRQMAYEWDQSKDAYPDSPFQGGLAYFVRPAGDDAVGSFADRTSLRMMTAFIRTVEVARSIWHAPDDLALGLARRALPLEPTLAFLRPNRPAWLPALSLGVTKDASSISDFIINTHAALEALEPQAALLALVTPLHVSNYEIVELTVVRWRRWGSKTVEPSDLWARYMVRQHRAYGDFYSNDWGLQSSISTPEPEQVIDEKYNAAPMAAHLSTSYIGYLQRDLFPERLYLPVITGMPEDLIVEPSRGTLSITASGNAVASLSYWTAGWSPCHPSGSSGLVGTSLIGRVDGPRSELEDEPDGHFYLWRLTRRTRKSGYGGWDEEAPAFGAIEF